MSFNFHIDTYCTILQAGLNSGYEFIFFEEKNQKSENKFCILRHDIDTDLKAAYEMACLENEMGIKSTYFLMLRSPVYNLFGRSNHLFVEKIISLGHAIGLHYDEGFYPNNGKSLEDLVSIEAGIFKDMFNCEIKAVSFHQPGKKIQENEIKINKFINTYDKNDMKDIFYLSDSNMIWKNETPDKLFANITYQKIQLLIHPMWWVGKDNENTETLWNKALLDNITRSLNQIIETERAFGPPRKIVITGGSIPEKK